MKKVGQMNKEIKESKTLRLVSTPIGNLEDLSSRGLLALKEADLIVAEDTRVTQKLCGLFEVEFKEKKMLAFHEHNQEMMNSLLEEIEQASFPIIVSDAGSPVLSDPAFPIVKGWIARGFQVESIPGPSAVTMAVELSGLPPIPFEFSGFLPRKKEALIKHFQALESGKTYVFFESPHRILESLEQLCTTRKEAKIFVGRELTKKFEEHWHFHASEWSQIKDSIKAKGEFVLALNIEGVSSVKNTSRFEEMAETYLKKSTPKNLAKLLSEITGKKTSDIYEVLTRN